MIGIKALEERPIQAELSVIVSKLELLKSESKLSTGDLIATTLAEPRVHISTSQKTNMVHLRAGSIPCALEQGYVQRLVIRFKRAVRVLYLQHNAVHGELCGDVCSHLLQR